VFPNEKKQDCDYGVKKKARGSWWVAGEVRGLKEQEARRIQRKKKG